MTSTAAEAARHEDAWWKSSVVYQVYPRSFADSDGDGVGDLDGITAHLDHLAGLGVDVIWLSPVYRSPQNDNGYDISDYQDIDPVFGDLAAFDRLLAAVHAHGMRLVMDLVVNHTSDEHPWFQESRDPASPRRDWYWWRRGRTDGCREPTNWGSFFSGSAWAYDSASDAYYLHLFAPGQPDLNWENPEVRQAVYAMMRWWLARGVDGFRMDVINLISKDPGLPDGERHGDRPYGDGSPYYVCGPRVHDYLQEMHREVFARHPGRVLTVGEMPGVTVEQAALFTDPARAELDMVFQFEHVGLDHGRDKFDPGPLRLSDLKNSLARWQSGLAETGWNSLYWNNHDQPRAVSRFGDDSPAHRERSAKALATVLHLHRGTPYIYQGEELGMTNAPFATADDFSDIESLNHYAQAIAGGAAPEDVLPGMRAMGRDNARTPMQWNAGANAGFTEGVPWLPVNPNHTTINAESARARPDSVYHHYRALIELRHTEPAVVHGDFTMLLPDDERIYAYLRRYGTTELLVLANLTGEPAEAELPAGWEGTELVLGNMAYEDSQREDSPYSPSPYSRSRYGHTGRGAAPQTRGGVPLAPWEARVHRRTGPQEGRHLPRTGGAPDTSF
ncbi:glycoside hydrolase family 13 protein [Streptomyces tsukubensis]|uniref:Glucohydrolase n=1 Tax=Streptomyces tsukubensis TaxID=83656 RepID=A0A1V4AF63_9ACTN|nr:alpha-glucosidase [Streptomyces tsukubensis]OON82706.1 glucohydrolase [Streptomyces tsukubensis]QFR92121.1 alpha,alpha-phosphotrehalase [Streptomyces tsukubensis]